MDSDHSSCSKSTFCIWNPYQIIRVSFYWTNDCFLWINLFFLMKSERENKKIIVILCWWMDSGSSSYSASTFFTCAHIHLVIKYFSWYKYLISFGQIVVILWNFPSSGVFWHDISLSTPSNNFFPSWDLLGTHQTSSL